MFKSLVLTLLGSSFVFPAATDSRPFERSDQEAEPVITEQDELVEKLTEALTRERNTIARQAAELAELRLKYDELTNKHDTLKKKLTEMSYDARPVVITQVLLARTVAVAKGGQLPQAMKKKLAAWERRIEPTVRAVNDRARSKGTDWLTALKAIDGSGKSADLLSFRDAADLVKELNAFALELHSFAQSK